MELFDSNAIVHPIYYIKSLKLQIDSIRLRMCSMCRKKEEPNFRF